MDQTKLQELLNSIEEQAREAVHSWYSAQIEKGREADLCPACLEARVQAYAADVAESALGFICDEDDARPDVGEFMAFCDQEDAHEEAEAAGERSNVGGLAQAVAKGH